MSNGPFIAWAARSLIGHIVFFEIGMLPIFIVFVGVNFSYATVGWAVRGFLMCSVTGLLLAVAIWYMVTLPLIRRLRKTP